ncbi:MAG: response regulator [Nitrospirae bacterium]|nr:response regulator [Nitrospirota bacterium]
MNKNNKNVLIVDADAHIRAIIKKCIIPDGYEIHECKTAIEAFDLYKKYNSNLIITDTFPHEESGIEFIKKVRSISNIVPIIAITEYNNVNKSYDLIIQNIFLYLKKPFVEPDRMGIVIKNAIEHSTETVSKINGQFIKKYPDNPEKFIHEITIAKQEWESAVDFIDRLIMIVDTERNICRCNYYLTEISGLVYKEIINKKWDNVLKNIGFNPIPGDCYLYGGVELYNDITKKWMLLQMYPFYEIYTKDRKVTRQVITLYDITKLKSATEETRRQREKIRSQNIELQNHKEKLEAALDQLSELIIQAETEQSFSVRFENPDLVSCSESLDCKKTTCPCYGQRNIRCWQISGTHCGGEIQGDFAQKLGRCEHCPVYIKATENPIFRIGEHFNNMMNMLEKKNKEAKEAYEKLKSTQAQVLQQEKMASIGQLAAGIAHEINNPVGFIMSNLNSLQKYMTRLGEFINIQNEANSQLISEGASSEIIKNIQEKKKSLKIDFILEDSNNLIKESLDGADRVKHIVQDLKSFSRIDEAEFKMANINEGIESTINIVWNELKYKARLNKEYGDIPLTKCNPGQLNQVFMNILVNAAQAIEKKGEITVKTWANDGYINIEISDTGCGIPEDKIGRIFEPFFTTKEVGKGTGLGLSIAYDIINKHKGFISVDSEAGKGTTFTIQIPIVDQ